MIKIAKITNKPYITLRKLGSTLNIDKPASISAKKIIPAKTLIIDPRPPWSSTPPIIAALLVSLFLIGLALGYIYSRQSADSTKEKMQVVISIVVTVVWVAAMIADIFLTGYTISPMVHAIMGAVVGYFFAGKNLDITIGDDG